MLLFHAFNMCILIKYGTILYSLLILFGEYIVLIRLNLKYNVEIGIKKYDARMKR